MEKHYKLNDTEFENSFKNCELDPILFTHEAHLRLAWIHVTKYGEENAIQNISEQLRRFVVFAGAKDKYNQTLTVAAIKSVSHFVRRSSTHTFQEFINEFSRLKNNFKELMAVHYGVDIYHSPQVKAVFLEPDLVPFD
jgi:hypothetical protein